MVAAFVTAFHVLGNSSLIHTDSKELLFFLIRLSLRFLLVYRWPGPETRTLSPNLSSASV
jgi:hypothetical protein